MTKRILAAAQSLTRIDSPLGSLRAIFTSEELIGLYLPTQAGIEPFDQLPSADQRLAAPVLRWLAEYFSSSSDQGVNEGRMPSLQLRLIGTEFQQQVWNQLQSIQFGQRRHYGQIAREIGRPTATRAVGVAIGDNPLSLIIPCHRVVGASGDLTGYAGGLAAKRWLLDHESHAEALLV